MDFNEYQEITRETAIYPGVGEETEDAIAYTTLGLTGESGEVAEKLKKYYREGDPSYIKNMKCEIGDVLWYLARLADELGMDLEDVAEENVEKLWDRQERDVIEGTGDDR